MRQKLFQVLFYSLLILTTLNTATADVSSSLGLESLPLTTALTTELLVERENALSQKQNSLIFYLKDLDFAEKALPEKLKQLADSEITLDSLDKATLNKKETDVEIKRTNLALESAEHYLVELQENLKKRQTALDTLLKTSIDTSVQRQKIETLQLSIDLETKAVDLEQKHIKILKGYKDVAETHQQLAQTWLNALQKTYQQNQQKTLGDQAQQEERKYLEEAAKLRETLAQLTSTDSETKRYLLEVEIQNADLRAQMSQLKLKLAPIKTELAQLHTLATQTDTYISSEMFEKGQALIAKVTLLREQLDSKITLLTQQREVTRKRIEILTGQDLNNYQQVEEQLTDLIQDFQQLLVAFPNSQAVIQSLQRAFFKSRRTLPNTFKAWQDLGTEITTLPTLFIKKLHEIWINFSYGATQAHHDRALLVSIGLFLWLSSFLWIRHRLSHFYALKKGIKHSFGINVLLAFLKTLNKNTFGLILVSLFLFLMLLIKPSYAYFIFSTVLIFSWLAAKVQINFISLLLLDDQEVEENYLKLYKHLRWITIIVWLLLSLMVVGHVLEISLTLRNLLESFFMVSLFLTLHPTAQIRKKILVSIEAHIKNYWVWVIRLTSFLPLLLISAVALLGLIGFINLGWAIAKVLGWFLLTLTGWLIARGLLIEGIILLKNYALRHSDYGLLWTQDIIPLFHKLFEITLFCSAGLIFTWLNDWHDNVTVQNTIREFFEQDLFTVDDNSITVFNILMSILAITAVVWLGRWFRQMTYRWIYLGVTDLGLRNSLSVLTQYAIIFIGLLITLRIMGIDLTTLTVFAGALGIGIGFGLQTIANNFISGIILLIERPLRKGDYVTIGSNYEGEIIDIGIRSLTIQAWNYQEIIVPNAEVIAHAFTNWTHSDNIVRTTLYVRTSYEDDPERTLTVLTSVLVNISEILTKPEPIVLLWEFADAWMVFRVDYYIDVLQYSRVLLKTRSYVWLKIWQALRETDIHIVYPRHDTYLKSVPSTLATSPHFNTNEALLPK